jgi:hypothetical protein
MFIDWLFCEAGVCSALQSFMFDVREQNVVSGDHLHFTNYL